MKKQLQFQLWQECNSRCQFCYLGKQNRSTPKEIKIASARGALQKISDMKTWEEYSVVSYLGGQFFQGQLDDPEVKEAFMDLMKKTSQLCNARVIDQIWLYATMTIGDQRDLFQTLDLFEDKSRVWLLTSFDTRGRFHTKKMEETWSETMLKLHQCYPEMKFNITTILSQDCIQKYLSGQLSFKEMMEKYHASFFFKQCGTCGCSKAQSAKSLPWFFPTRSRFIEFLRKFKLQQSDQMWTKLFNIYYRADTLYRNFNQRDHQMALNIRHKDSVRQVQTQNQLQMRANKCGHLLTYAAYSDCDGCVICDKEMINQLLA